MDSKGKRMRYVSEMCTTSSDESFEEVDFQSKNETDHNVPDRQRRKPRCLSRNALMARENRLKKKMYVNKLEKEVSLFKNENKKLTSFVKNQSLLIADLTKEVKYLKSIVANSNDIKNLIRNIHNSTGMSVSSSLDTNLSLKNVSVPKKSLVEPEPELFSTSDCLFGDDLGLNMNLCEDFTNFPLLLPNDVLNGNVLPTSSSLGEHNYTAPKDSDEDVGVCLHVSKHKVSLEFCSKCNDKASESWNRL